MLKMIIVYTLNENKYSLIYIIVTFTGVTQYCISVDYAHPICICGSSSSNLTKHI